MTTIVFVPGSFAPASLYIAVVKVLTSHSVRAVIVDMPSVGRREGKPPATMRDDADEISRVVTPLIDEGREVILVAHSYGGIPATQSLERLSQKARSATGRSGGVRKMVYLTSVVLQVGASNFDLFGQNLSSFAADDYMRLDPAANAPLTFSDLPGDEALRYAKQMPVHSTASFKEKLGYAGYKDVEVHYIVCEEDKIIPPAYQYGFIEMIKALTKRKVGVHKINSGHVPSISQPEVVARMLVDIAGSV